MAYQFECPQQGCEFMVRANDEDEVVDVAQEHARDKHGMSMSRDDIQGNVQQA